MCSHWQVNCSARRLRARVAQQAPRLREQRFVAGQLAGGGGAAQFRIRQRRPQEVTQPRGQLGVCHRHRLRATTRFLTAIQKRRRGQHPGDRQLNRLLVRNLALPQSAIQRPQYPPALHHSTAAAMRAPQTPAHCKDASARPPRGVRERPQPVSSDGSLYGFHAMTRSGRS